MSEIDPRLREHIAAGATLRRGVRRGRVRARAAPPAGCGGARAGAGEARGGDAVAREPPAGARDRRGVRARPAARRRRRVRPRRAPARRTSPPSPGAAGHRRAARRGALGAVAAAHGPRARGGVCLRRTGLHRRPGRGRPGRARRRRPRRRRRCPGSRRSSPMHGRCRSPTGRSTRFCSSRRSSTSAPTTRCTASTGEPDDSGRSAALRELRRILKPSGSLLVTVPLGEPRDYGWFRQEDVRGWTHLFTDAGFFVEEQEAYELGEDGWRSAPTFDPRGVVYGDAWPGGFGGALRRAQPTPAAAARLARRRAAHGAAPSRAVVPQAARRLARAAGRRSASDPGSRDRQQAGPQRTCHRARFSASTAPRIAKPSARRTASIKRLAFPC